MGPSRPRTTAGKRPRGAASGERRPGRCFSVSAREPLSDEASVNIDEPIHAVTEVERLRELGVMGTREAQKVRVVEERVEAIGEGLRVSAFETEAIVHGEVARRALGAVGNQDGQARRHGLHNGHPFELDVAGVHEDVCRFVELLQSRPIDESDLRSMG